MNAATKEASHSFLFFWPESSHIFSSSIAKNSGFTSHRSTTDRIATLRMIKLQPRQEFKQPSWIAYADFCAAFDSVNRLSLWLLLWKKGVPSKIIELLEDLYSKTVSCVWVDGQMSGWFVVTAGVLQGCIVAPDMFFELIDWTVTCTIHRGYVGLMLGKEVSTDVDFAEMYLFCLRCSKSLYLHLKSWMKNHQLLAWKLIGSKPTFRLPVTWNHRLYLFQMFPITRLMSWSPLYIFDPVLTQVVEMTRMSKEGLSCHVVAWKTSITVSGNPVYLFQPR